MPKKPNKKRWLFFLFITAGLVLLSGFSGLAIYGWQLSKEVDARFSSRRWQIPSTVYSDTTLLYPGQKIQPDELFEKFKRLGYRVVSNLPDRQGEMVRHGDAFEIFLKAVHLPAFHRDGFSVTITVNEQIIESISRHPGGAPVPILELEPEELMLFFGKEREKRRLISIKEVPDFVKKAFLAAEDTRFYRHHGIDGFGILRAVLINIRHMDWVQGGSTITQQLAKNYFLTPDKNLIRKFRELILSLVMEFMYEKDEILEIYLNEIYFGQKGSIAVNGLGEASRFYFGKPVGQLTLAEAATIAGLVKAPNIYSPYIHPERSVKRRNDVLNGMRDQEWISRTDHAAAVASALQPAGYSNYHAKAPYFMDYLSGQLESLYSRDDLSRLGLSIFTTLDTQVQKAAEDALLAGLERMEAAHPDLKRDAPLRRIQGAVVVMQPRTGYILAMVGGRDYSVSQFNRAVQARRQPGSAFKPFVFLSALERFRPSDKLSTAPITYQVNGKPWRPSNFSPVAERQVDLREALARSINTATVALAMDVGLNEVVRTASAFHFTTPLKPVPAIALGALEVIPLELARAYCAFAADGLLPAALSIKDVCNERGRILEHRHMEVERVTSPAKAFLMISMLQSVTENGTARSLSRLGIRQPVAGKTGTTNNSRDAWFVGTTPDIMALIWVGFDDGASVKGTGSSAALPIWAALMKNIPQYLSGRWFAMPEGVSEKTICSESGMLAIPDRCPKPRSEYFLTENAPVAPCPIHKPWNPVKSILEKIEEFTTHDR